MPRTINARDLEATALILDVECPELRHHINSITRRGPLPSGPVKPGQSIYHSYALELRLEDAKAILSALVDAEKKLGGAFEVYGATLWLLTMIWRGHVEHLQAKIDQ